MSAKRRDATTPPRSLYSSSKLHLVPSSPLFTYSPSISPFISNADSAGWVGWYPVSDLSGIWFGWYSDATPDVNDGKAGGWVILNIMNADSFIINYLLPSSTNTVGWTVQAQIDGGTPVEISSGRSITVPGGGGGTTHTLRIQASCTGLNGCGSSSDPFRFTGVDVGVGVASGSSISSASLDDTSSLITYQGYTTSSSSPSSSPAIIPQDLIGGGMHSTLSYTKTKGATASVIFHGSSIMIIGTTGPSLSTYTISLSSLSSSTTTSILTQTANASLPLNLPVQIISFISGLADDSYILTITNDVKDGGVVLDGFWCWSSSIASFGHGSAPVGITPSTMTNDETTMTGLGGGFVTIEATGSMGSSGIPIGTSGPSVGTIIGIVVGILAVIAMGIALFFYLKPKPKAPPAATFANPSDVSNALPNQENQFVSVRPDLGDGGGVNDQQGYSYPGANFKKPGGPPRTPWN